MKKHLIPYWLCGYSLLIFLSPFAFRPSPALADPLSAVTDTAQAGLPVIGGTLDLQEALALAEQNNQALKVAEEKLAQSSYNFMEAKTTKRMKIDASSTLTKQQDTFDDLFSFPQSLTIPPLTGGVSIPIVGTIPVSVDSFTLPLPQPSNVTLSASTVYSSAFTLKKPLYTSGKLEGLVSQARLNHDLAKLHYEKTRRDITFQVTSAYYNVLKAKQMAKISHEAYANTEKQFEVTNIKLTAGKIPEFEVIHAKVELSSAKQAVFSSDNAYQTSKAAFFALIGVSPTSDMDLEDEVRYEKGTFETQDSLSPTAYSLPPASPSINYQPSTDNWQMSSGSWQLTSMIDYATTHRPEIKEIELTKSMAFVGIDLAKANLGPNLGMGASYNWTGNTFPGAIKSWNVSLAFSMPLYDSQETKWKIRSSRSNLKQVLETEKQLKNQIALEVTQAFYKLKQAQSQLDALKPTLTEAKQTMTIAQTRYNAYLASHLEVADARLLHLKAQTQFVSALYDAKIAEAELKKALGR